MAVCPNGHDSASDGFCDVCGMRIGGNSANFATAPVGAAPSGGFRPAQEAGPGELCPRCGTLRVGQFCESCGFKFASPGPRPAPSFSSGPQLPLAPSAPEPSSFPYPQTTWTAEVGADRAYYERVQAVTGAEGAAVAFPAYYTERRFQLLGNQMRIGRRSVSRGLAPEIDLTGPPADPGISRLHAVLIAVPDGSWAVLDPGSANGTLVNGTEIAIGDHIPLRDGDRINLGAWTAITVHRD
jgi:FHA domain